MPERFYISRFLAGFKRGDRRPNAKGWGESRLMEGRTPDSKGRVRIRFPMACGKLLLGGAHQTLLGFSLVA